MDANAREKIRMLTRILEPIEREVGRVLSDEEDKLASRAAASRENEAQQIPDEGLRNLTDACSAIENALDHMQLVIGKTSA
jgi:hypothetical protein